MTSIGIRELKQNPSAVVARVERGESLTITVQGRPAAQIVPLAGPRRHWVSSSELDAALGAERSDETGWHEEWHASRDDDPITDPWANGE